jgi:hypothetical protein
MGLRSGASVWYWLLLALWCQAMPIFLQQQLAENFAHIPNPDPKKWSHLWSWNHISCLQTIGYYPPHGSDKWCFNVILAPAGLVVFGHANFWQELAEKLAHITNSDRKSDPICGHETISVASRLLEILHMGLISGASVWYRLLLAWWCQAMSILTIVVWKLTRIRYPLIQKVIPFAVMKQYQLPPDYWISSTWVW